MNIKGKAWISLQKLDASEFTLRFTDIRFFPLFSLQLDKRILQLFCVWK